MPNSRFQLSPTVIDFLQETLEKNGAFSYYDEISKLGSPYGALARDYGGAGSGFEGNLNYFLAEVSNSWSSFETYSYKMGINLQGDGHTIGHGIRSTGFKEVQNLIRGDLAREHFRVLQNEKRLPNTPEIQKMHNDVFAKHGLEGGWIGNNLIMGPITDFMMGKEPTDFSHCFLAGTMISMWPLDVQPDTNGNYDEKEVLAKVWKKPIEDITPSDWVLSFDKENKLKPGKVTRTFQNEAKIILDFHGTFVTPGHVYYREDSKKANKFEPLIDILRADGIIRHQDGTLIRATTGCEVGSKDDEQFWAFTVDQVDGGERVRDKKQLRLGTRWMLPNGQHFSMREYMEGIGVELIEEGEFKGYVRHKKNGLITIFVWVLSDALPNPEDFVLQRSQTSLEEIYRAGEWESMRPQMPAPMVMDGGPVQALGNSDYEQMPRNMPMSFKNETPSSALLPSRQSQPTMNRQQRRAMERKQRKAQRSQGQIIH